MTRIPHGLRDRLRRRDSRAKWSATTIQFVPRKNLGGPCYGTLLRPTLPRVSENDEKVAGEDALLPLIREHFLIGLVRQMQQTYPGAGIGELEDAVAEAVRKLVERLRKEPPVTDVRGYLAKVSYNEFKKAAQRTSDHETPLEDRPEQAGDSAEDGALRHAAVDAIKSEIRTWENANVREVMLVYVDSIAYGEPLEAAEVAEIASTNLGEEVSAGSVRVWKARGLARLREFVEDAGLIDTRWRAGGEGQ